MNSGFLESASEQINKSMPSLEGKSVSDLKSFGLGSGQHPGFRPGIPRGLSAFLHASGPSGRHDVAWPLVLGPQIARQRGRSHPNPLKMHMG